MKKNAANPFDDPVTTLARYDATLLVGDLTVREALDSIRNGGSGERIVYFYVTDPEGRLAGVIPTRRLLTAALDQRLDAIMAARVLAIPSSATVLEACEMFVMHRFLAFPVVDEERRVVGVVDVGAFEGELLDYAERERTEEMFETIGFRIAGLRSASAFKAFLQRFPWLLVTIAGGSFCAYITNLHEHTLEKSIVLAFFIVLVLGLAESVVAQSIALSIQSLRSMRPTLRSYLRAVARELVIAAMLGLGCGTITALVVLLWHGAPGPAFAIGASVLAALCSACFFGISVPSLLHALRLDPKIAAGPVALALTDIATIASYFVIAVALLG
jgi:magnesium transporter